MNCLIENGYISGSYIDCYNMLNMAQGGGQILWEIVKTCLGFLAGACLAIFTQNRQHTKLINTKEEAVRFEMKDELEKLKLDINNLAVVVNDIAVMKKSMLETNLDIPPLRSVALLEKNVEEIYLKAPNNSKKRIKPIILFFSNLENTKKEIDTKVVEYLNRSGVIYYNKDMEYAKLNLKYIRYACGAAINIRAYLNNEDIDDQTKAGDEYIISFCKELNVDYEKINSFVS